MSDSSYSSDFNPEDVLGSLERGLPFSGPLSFLRSPRAKELGAVDIAVIGVPFDLGATNRPGSRYGPRAIREQSVYVGAFPPLYPWDYDVTERCSIVDAGDVVSIPTATATDFMLAATQAVAEDAFAAGASLLTLGGDHTLPYGPVRAAAQAFGPVALIHVDSHQDSHDSDSMPELPLINHGTFATELAKEGAIDLERSSQVYIRTHMPQPPNGSYEITYADDALELGPLRLAEKVRARAGDGPVYVTFDIDAIDPAYAPGTGSPVPGGPTSSEVRRFLRALAGLDVVAADIVEVNPPYDAGETTAVLGAMLAVDLCHLLSEGRERRGVLRGISAATAG